MSFLTRQDYLNESKRYKSKDRTSKRRGSHGGLQVGKKIRLPTQMKSEKLYCRNCLVQIEAYGVGKPCKQCDKITVPLKRRL